MDFEIVKKWNNSVVGHGGAWWGVREAGEAIIVTGAEDGAVRMMRYASGMEGI